MTIRGVLFDFSGTLFRLEATEGWLDGLMDDAEAAEMMRRLTAPVASEEGLPEDFERRDLDQAAHRSVHVEMLVRSGVPGYDVAEAIYDRLLEPTSWRPYPDTASALRTLREQGVPAAVVSNIGWDIRVVFKHYDLLDQVDEVFMSYVEGMIKPEPEFFRIACERIGLPPDQVLMIGDSEEADGGAAALGCSVAIVPPLPSDQRTDALIGALKAHGLIT
ncbi:HAD family hydrolase [Allokutzneria oryzae]|uniref:HAD family hydrolase n=1 Tax=Allokutzneria oryzae TaxID=1378989 RepID=A0ABV6A2J0_9PSEU